MKKEEIKLKISSVLNGKGNYETVKPRRKKRIYDNLLRKKKVVICKTGPSTKRIKRKKMRKFSFVKL